MNTFAPRLLAALSALAVVGAASAAEMIQNGDFGVAAGTLDHWTHDGSIFSPVDGTTTPHDFVTTSSAHSHSTRFSADMNIENFSGSGYTSRLRQDFSPVPGSGVSSITAWAYSFDQDLRVELLYSDNTHTTGSKTFNDAVNENTSPDKGFQLWDMTSLVNPAKTLTGIRFEVETGGFNKGNNIFIDDVSVQAVPEPATLGALAVGALGLLRRRTRRA